MDEANRVRALWASWFLPADRIGRGFAFQPGDRADTQPLIREGFDPLPDGGWADELSPIQRAWLMPVGLRVRAKLRRIVRRPDCEPEFEEHPLRRRRSELAQLEYEVIDVVEGMHDGRRLLVVAGCEAFREDSVELLKIGARHALTLDTSRYPWVDIQDGMTFVTREGSGAWSIAPTPSLRDRLVQDPTPWTGLGL